MKTAKKDQKKKMKKFVKRKIRKFNNFFCFRKKVNNEKKIFLLKKKEKNLRLKVLYFVLKKISFLNRNFIKNSTQVPV